jgi:hypothetical protein
MFVDFNNYIEIDNRENICSVCTKPYKHYRMNFIIDDIDKSIKETKIVTAHPMCRHLTNTINECHQKLKNIK